MATKVKDMVFLHKKIKVSFTEDILDVIDGHKGQGYGVSTPEDLGRFH